MRLRIKKTEKRMIMYTSDTLSELKRLVIVLCSNDNELKYVDLAIPVNNKRLSLSIVYYLIAREILREKGSLPVSEAHTRCLGWIIWCGGWDLNPRTPKWQGPQPCAFDHAGRPPHSTQHKPSLPIYAFCGWGCSGESNPVQRLHRPVCYHYTTAATQPQSILWSIKRVSNPHTNNQKPHPRTISEPLQSPPNWAKRIVRRGLNLSSVWRQASSGPHP